MSRGLGAGSFPVISVFVYQVPISPGSVGAGIGVGVGVDIDVDVDVVQIIVGPGVGGGRLDERHSDVVFLILSEQGENEKQGQKYSEFFHVEPPEYLRTS